MDEEACKGHRIEMVLLNPLNSFAGAVHSDNALPEP